MLRYKTETRPGLVDLYDIRPGNGAGQFLQPRSQHGAIISKIHQKYLTSCIPPFKVTVTNMDRDEQRLWSKNTNFAHSGAFNAQSFIPDYQHNSLHFPWHAGLLRHSVTFQVSGQLKIVKIVMELIDTPVSVNHHQWQCYQWYGEQELEQISRWMPADQPESVQHLQNNINNQASAPQLSSRISKCNRKESD